MIAFSEPVARITVSDTWDDVLLDHGTPRYVIRTQGDRLLVCCLRCDRTFSHLRGRASHALVTHLLDECALFTSPLASPPAPPHASPRGTPPASPRWHERFDDVV